MIDLAKLAESALPGHPNTASIMATVAPVLVAAITDEVRKLHRPHNEKLWMQDCIEGDCEHWTEDTNSCEEHCPPVTERVCAHCYEMGDRPDDGFESYFSASIHYPCPTVQLADALDAACGVTR